MRVGIGFDAHRLVAGLPLALGGVAIPWEKGLAGHSDGDVALHALIDALLGAAGLGDIGEHFPPTEERFRGIASRQLLREVRTRVAAAGFRVEQVDLVIIAEQPRLAPYRAAMRAAIAEDLGLSVERVGVKATTTDGLGFTGRGEGIAAHAVALIVPR